MLLLITFKNLCLVYGHQLLLLYQTLLKPIELSAVMCNVSILPTQL